ncbi:LamB/YcsF family protein [Romboutsia sp. 1001713B170207_170306_H8]|uniref:LamB/YcsF family protein n=1 Tax=Romboutsia sp. 1001713B170207_170306_H8 TaxID=2787112 RepID=UPI000821F457|nr:5-oxoprolinase subunit PxpA [Romboutsia sp. 1001713B170207_170306_H8]SCH66228.1 LamB/YcsF family protein [uncultured Clostridium sp.]
MLKVDLNCDLGESFGKYQLGLDEDVIKYISSANIACGFHASDPLVMEKTVDLAKKNNVSIGAHPGYPDLLGFGRRNMNISLDEAKAYIKYQLGALYSFCKCKNIKLSHIKPHGAFYNMAAVDYDLAKSICESIYEFDKEIILLGLSNSQMIKAANDIGIRYAREVFADRAYEDNGSLVDRSKDGALIADENLAVSRVIEMIKNKRVKTITGKYIDIEVDSICVHGDSIKALEFVKTIKNKLENENIKIAPLDDIVKI